MLKIFSALLLAAMFIGCSESAPVAEEANVTTEEVAAPVAEEANVTVEANATEANATAE